MPTETITHDLSHGWHADWTKNPEVPSAEELVIRNSSLGRRVVLDGPSIARLRVMMGTFERQAVTFSARNDFVKKVVAMTSEDLAKQHEALIEAGGEAESHVERGKIKEQLRLVEALSDFKYDVPL